MGYPDTVWTSVWTPLSRHLSRHTAWTRVWTPLFRHLFRHLWTHTVLTGLWNPLLRHQSRHLSRHLWTNTVWTVGWLVVAALTMVHLLILHQTGRRNPLGVSRNFDKVKFHPYFTRKDLFGFFGILAFLIGLCLVAP